MSTETDDEIEIEKRKLTQVMLAFRDTHGRAPTMDELRVWWKAHCEAELRRLIELVTRAGTPVVYENGEYKILPFGTDLTRN
jgi:hypothetical protein